MTLKAILKSTVISKTSLINLIESSSSWKQRSTLSDGYHSGMTLVHRPCRCFQSDYRNARICEISRAEIARLRSTLSQSCTRVQMLGSDPTRPGKSVTRPDPLILRNSWTRPDPTRPTCLSIKHKSHKTVNEIVIWHYSSH